MALTIEVPALGTASGSWSAWESLAVAMSHEVPAQALALVLDQAQEDLVEAACGPRWAPVRGLVAPFACPGCGRREDFARKGKRTRPRKLRTAAGTVEMILWHVGCRKAQEDEAPGGCGKVFSPLLLMLGLSGKRRTDRLSLDLAELGTQMSFARAAAVDAQLAGTDATAGVAHHSMADLAAMLTGAGPGPVSGEDPAGSDHADAQEARDDDDDADGAPPVAVLGPGHPRPKVVLLDGTGARAGTKTNGVGVNLAIGLTGRSGPARRRAATSHLLGLTVGEDWSMMGAQLACLPAPALVVVDGEAAITALTQRLWPAAPIQRCWWHLPHGLRKAFYADDAANRHVNPNWARTKAAELAELLREQIRAEHTTEQALAAWDEFTTRIPEALSSAHTYLGAAREHAFTCLDTALRKELAHLGGPELGTGVIERLMRELNARTDIGGVRWSIPGLRDLLTVLTARALHHPTWKEICRNTRPANTIPFCLQKFNAI